MKRIVLVRHGKADQSKTDVDFDRTLTPVGQKDCKIIAEVVFAKNIQPDLIVTSDAVRAVETADIFADVFGLSPKSVIKEHFLYDGYTTGQLTDYISKLPDDFNTIVVVGHNPFISQAGIRLSKNFHQSFSTTGCLSLTFDCDKWTIEAGLGDIEFFEFPKKYR